MSDVDLSVVVPVFNNQASLDELVDRVIAVLEPLPFSFELIFVDDGSADRSFEILRRRAAADSRLRLFALSRNFGSQSALCAGFDLVRGKRVLCLDADLENLPEDIPRLLAALDQGHDLACGVREERADSWLQRRLPSRLLNWYVRRRVGTSVRDIGCGLRAMEARLVRNLAAEGEARRLMTPLLLRRARSVLEVPIRHAAPRPSGHSFLSLLGIAVDYYLLTARRPFLVAGLAAGVAAAAGALCLALAVFAGSVRLALAGLVLLMGSAACGVAALAGEYAQRIYQLGQGAPFYELRDPETEPVPEHRERSEPGDGAPRR